MPREKIKGKRRENRDEGPEGRSLGKATKILPPSRKQKGEGERALAKILVPEVRNVGQRKTSLRRARQGGIGETL